jgi:hypothetical protein
MGEGRPAQLSLWLALHREGQESKEYKNVYRNGSDSEPGNSEPNSKLEIKPHRDLKTLTIVCLEIL